MNKDTPDTIPTAAFIAPGIILAVVLVNCAVGEVYWPAKHRLVDAYHDSWRFWGTILFKLGMAGGLFAWYGMANWNRTLRAALPTLAASIAIAGLGLLAFCIGFF